MSLDENKSSTISISKTEVELNNSKNKNNNKDITCDLNRNMFKFNYVIGKGGFGKVWQVILKKTQEKYALKEMSKAKIIDKKSQRFINNELTLLKKLRNDFIVNIYYAFQDKDNLYLVIDFLSGGDLRFHVSRYHIFSEEQTRFFISCIIQGLSHIHYNNIIHRDIKPENLVLDSRGYVRITDFGIAKENEKDNSSETSGTPGYMSPEVLFKKNHSFSTDFFAIGVIGFEFMRGKRPFTGSKEEIKEKMKDRHFFEEKVKIKDNDKIYQKGWSCECVDFINSLLEIDPNKRLGNKGGINELKEHQWLKYYLWEEIENKKLDSPYMPDIDKDNFDKDYCEKNEIITEKTKKRYSKIISGDEYRNAFVNFYFNKDINNNINNHLNKKNLHKKKIVIDGNMDNKQLKTSRSNKNKMLLNIKKFTEENANNKETNNNELIKEIIGKNSNILLKNNQIIQSRETNNNEELYIRKLIIKNTGRNANNKKNKAGNNYSLSPRIINKKKDIFIKNYNSSHSNSNSNSHLNVKSENNIKQYNFLNININNIKNKNIFTSSNKPLINSNNNINNNQMYKNNNSKNQIINSKINYQKINTFIGPNFRMYQHKNKNIRDLFFKKVLNPFSRDKKQYNNIIQSSNIKH